MYVLIIEVFIIIDLICVIGNDIDQSLTDVADLFRRQIDPRRRSRMFSSRTELAIASVIALMRRTMSTMAAANQRMIFF